MKLSIWETILLTILSADVALAYCLSIPFGILATVIFVVCVGKGLLGTAE